MGGMRRRIERLERQPRWEPAPGERPEDLAEREKRAWIFEKRAWLADSRDPGDHHARGVTAVLASRAGPQLSAEGLLSQVLAWRPAPDLVYAERAVAMAIHEGKPGTEGMEVPSGWREAFEAAAELRERVEAAPDELLARWLVASWRREQGEAPTDGEAEELARERERHGLTEGLFEAAAGPDAAALTEEQAKQRLREVLEGFYSGEKGWLVQEEIYRLTSEQSPRQGREHGA